MTRLQRDTVAYLLITAFGILMLVWGIPNYTPPYPGYGASPALVPNVAMGVVLAMAVLALLRNAVVKFRGKAVPPEELEFPEDTNQGGFTQVGRIKLLRLGSFVIPCALLIVLIDYIGYVPAALLFMFTIQYVIGGTNWFRATLVSVAMVALMYVVMRYGFGVPVPGPQLF